VFLGGNCSTRALCTKVYVPPADLARTKKRHCRRSSRVGFIFIYLFGFSFSFFYIYFSALSRIKHKTRNETKRSFAAEIDVDYYCAPPPRASYAIYGHSYSARVTPPPQTPAESAAGEWSPCGFIGQRRGRRGVYYNAIQYVTVLRKRVAETAANDWSQTDFCSPRQLHSTRRDAYQHPL